MFTQVPTVETWQAILSAPRYYGSSAILLTPVADAPKRLEQAAGAVMRAMEIDYILGLHMEDPHISSAH